jgi:hypothetical protein
LPAPEPKQNDWHVSSLFRGGKQCAVGLEYSKSVTVLHCQGADGNSCTEMV